MLVDSIKPEVAKVALMTVGELCKTLRKAVDPIVEPIIRIVANKAGGKSISVFMLEGLLFSINFICKKRN